MRWYTTVGAHKPPIREAATVTVAHILRLAERQLKQGWWLRRPR